MKFVKVTSENIKELYGINRQLAIDEGQADLFTASFENYTKGFMDDNPIAFGTLCYDDDKLAGFAICNYKFATYLGFKVLYIEDIYLNKEHCSDENKRAFLKYLINDAFNNDCARVEMRVLNDFNWGIGLLNDLGFNKIDKWSVYRLSR